MAMNDDYQNQKYIQEQQENARKWEEKERERNEKAIKGNIEKEQKEKADAARKEEERKKNLKPSDKEIDGVVNEMNDREKGITDTLKDTIKEEQKLTEKRQHMGLIDRQGMMTSADHGMSFKGLERRFNNGMERIRLNNETAREIKSMTPEQYAELKQGLEEKHCKPGQHLTPQGVVAFAAEEKHQERGVAADRVDHAIGNGAHPQARADAQRHYQERFANAPEKAPEQPKRPPEPPREMAGIER